MLKKKPKFSDLVDVELTALIVSTVLLQCTALVVIGYVAQTFLK